MISEWETADSSVSGWCDENSGKADWSVWMVKWRGDSFLGLFSFHYSINNVFYQMRGYKYLKVRDARAITERKK